MTATRRATSLTLDSGLMEGAKAYKINLSRAAEAVVAAALKKAKTEAWQRENAEAIQNYNEYIEKHGLPLDKYRMF